VTVSIDAKGSTRVANGAARYEGLAMACCGVAIISLLPVALLQLKVVDRLPELPGSLFNSSRVVTSQAAYPLGIPDSLLGLASYATTLALLIAAKPSRPVTRTALRAKLLLDGALAARNTRKQVTEHGKICSWCMGAAIATAGMVYFARKAREGRASQ
jgi:uncharacterized membrane protein